MADVIRWGAVNRPGVGVEENLGTRAIVGASLGVTAFVGLTERGEVGQISRCRSLAEFKAKCGGSFYDDFASAFYGYVPDAVEGFFRASQGAGEVLVVRLEGGSAVKASVTFPSRLVSGSGGGDSLTLRAKNPGRWGGRHTAQTLTSNISAVGETTITRNSGAWVVNELAGASLINATTGVTHIIQSNTATIATVEADALMVTDDSAATTDTVTINLAHDTHHIAFKLDEGKVNKTDEFSLDVYVDGEIVLSYPRLSMDPTSAYYVVTVLADDPQNYYCEAVDAWAAASKTYVAAATPVNARGTSTALAATTLTDSGASFPTTGVEGYSLAGGFLVDPDDRTVRVPILSNTATVITVPDSYDLTSLIGSSPQGYEVVFPARAEGGINDHSGVGSGDYIDQFTDGVSALDRTSDLGLGLVKFGVPGLSGFSAANRKAINAAGIGYAAARSWQWQVETPSYIASSGNQNEADLLAVRDLLFETSGNNLGLDTIWANVCVVSWQRVRFPDLDNRLIAVPTMGDRLGLEARQASQTGGYIDPGAGLAAGSLPRAFEIDFDFARANIAQEMEKHSQSGMNFIVKDQGRFYVWGARLPQRTLPQFTFKHTREQMSHYALVLVESRALREAVLRPQTVLLRAQVGGQLRSFFKAEYDAGRIGKPGESFDQACAINVGPEINTAALQDTGVMKAEVSLSFPGLAERVIVSLSQAGVTTAIAA